MSSYLPLSKSKEEDKGSQPTSPPKSFVSPNFLMVGRLNTCKSFNKDSFHGDFCALWRLGGTGEVQERENDRFLFTFTSECDTVRVKKGGGSWGFQRAIVVMNDYDGLPPIQDIPLNFVWI